MLQVVLQPFERLVPLGRRDTFLVLASDGLLPEGDGWKCTTRVEDIRIEFTRTACAASWTRSHRLANETSVAFAAFCFPLPSLSFAFCEGGRQGELPLASCVDYRRQDVLLTAKSFFFSFFFFVLPSPMMPLEVSMGPLLFLPYSLPFP